MSLSVNKCRWFGLSMQCFELHIPHTINFVDEILEIEHTDTWLLWQDHKNVHRWITTPDICSPTQVLPQTFVHPDICSPIVTYVIYSQTE